MKHFGKMAFAALFVAGAAQGATLDLTQEITDFDTDVTAFSLIEDGVTFSFFDAVRPGLPDSFLNSAGATPGTVVLDGLAGPGLQVGGGGFSARGFSFTVSSAISWQGYTVDQRLGDGVTMSILDGATSLSSGNEISLDGSYALDSGPLLLDAGTTYTVTFVDTGSAKQSALEAFEFTTVTTTPVPLPAAMSLLLAGIGGLTLARRRAS